MPSEVLLEVFKRLSCQDMVKTRRVWKEWSDLINQNRTLWRRLVLGEERKDSELETILEFFDSKSQSTLREISLSIEAREMEDKEDEPTPASGLPAILLGSREILRIFNLGFEYEDDITGSMAALLHSLPQLIEFRLVNRDWESTTNLFIEVQDSQESQEVTQRDGNCLKVLGIWKSTNILGLAGQLLSNLTSLIIGWMLTSREGRDILEPSSHSLKHLDIEFIKSVDGDREIRPLAFPNLQLWESNYFPAPFSRDNHKYTRIQFPCKAASCLIHLKT